MGTITTGSACDPAVLLCAGHVRVCAEGLGYATHTAGSLQPPCWGKHKEMCYASTLPGFWKSLAWVLFLCAPCFLSLTASTPRLCFWEVRQGVPSWRSYKFLGQCDAKSLCWSPISEPLAAVLASLLCFASRSFLSPHPQPQGWQ